jgi:hypothetical protein
MPLIHAKRHRGDRFLTSQRFHEGVALSPLIVILTMMDDGAGADERKAMATGSDAAARIAPTPLDHSAVDTTWASQFVEGVRARAPHLHEAQLYTLVDGWSRHSARFGADEAAHIAVMWSRL